MSYTVLVVDDSVFFRKRVTEILNQDPRLTVIDVATNGLEAVEKAIKLRPDVITMDVEMPVLNGIKAVEKIMALAPTPILMFSSLTHDGAKATLDALEAGALDFLPKKFDEIARNSEEANKKLQQSVIALARKKLTSQPLKELELEQKTRFNSTTLTQKQTLRVSTRQQSTTVDPIVTTHRSSHSILRTSDDKKKYQLLAIGTSTGGPVALQKVLTPLPADFPLPILLIQHMPAAFTPAFAARLNDICKIKVKEAKDGDPLLPGVAYLAPGGQQMIVDGTNTASYLRVFEDNSARIAYKPSVDISFGSAAKVFHGNVLAIVLTGMGADGREGARMLKNKGATVWAQDEATSVVYGMPQAIVNAGLATQVLPINEIASAILKEIPHG
jgi:two-component system chemotaxis response regulator CheB